MFFQQLLDLTIEEALVKFGFRYTESRSAGAASAACSRSRSASSSSAACSPRSRCCALAPFAKQVWGTGGVVVPMLIASLIALAQAPENVAAGAIILRGRYDVRGAFLAVSMGLRLIGLAIGCRYGVVGAVLGMVVAQVLATIAIGVAGIAAFRRFPRLRRAARRGRPGGLRRLPLLLDARLVARLGPGDARHLARADGRADRPGRLLPQRPGARDRVRGALGPGAARDADRADARLRGRAGTTASFGMLRRYVAATGALMLVAVPVLWMRDAVPDRARLRAAPSASTRPTAARLVLLAAALQLVWGWTKSFPVSIGRPGLRVSSRRSRSRSSSRCS